MPPGDRDPNAIADLLRDRRTIHDFTDTPPPRDLIVEAIDVARWAPNHLRTEPWHFYVLDTATGARVAALNAELVAATKGAKAAAVKQRRWAAMPGWLVVTCARNDDQLRAREDYAACCCAIQNLSLYLWAQGVGMKWTTGAVTRDSRFFDLVGIDREAASVVGLFWYGYPASVPDQHRKPVDAVTSFVVGSGAP